MDKLLIIEYDTIEELREDLNPKLIGVDAIGLRPQDYQGYNFKAKVLRKWGSSRIKKLVKSKAQITYVIAYKSGDVETLNHEMRHYRYYSDLKYRSAVNKLYSTAKYHDIRAQLRKKGYRETVILDEAQASFPAEELEISKS